jgi:hypothetical protein
MNKLMKTVYDCSTGITTEVELTDEEVAQLEADKAALVAQKAEAEAKAQAKAELLERLGITADEAKLLLA